MVLRSCKVGTWGEVAAPLVVRGLVATMLCNEPQGPREDDSGGRNRLGGGPSGRPTSPADGAGGCGSALVVLGRTPPAVRGGLLGVTGGMVVSQKSAPRTLKFVSCNR